MAILFVSLFVLAISVLIAARIYVVRLRSAQSTPTNKRRDDVSGLSIDLEINDKRSLFLLLGSDGSINRLGTGTMDNTEDGLFIGVTDPAIFQAVKAQLSTELFQFLGGTFQLKNPLGASCKLTIAFQFNDNSSNGFVFLYGAESVGPPREVADLVQAAVRHTDRLARDLQTKRSPAKLIAKTGIPRTEGALRPCHSEAEGEESVSASSAPHRGINPSALRDVIPQLPSRLAPTPPP